MKEKTALTECERALNALYLEVDESIANDVKLKVLAAIREASPDWISVSERPPEDNIEVLTAGKSGKNYIVHKETAFVQRGAWYSEYGAYHVKTVSHWMYLPSPPTTP